jgi:hypothetical protein
MRRYRILSKLNSLGRKEKSSEKKTEDDRTKKKNDKENL